MYIPPLLLTGEVALVVKYNTHCLPSGKYFKSYGNSLGPCLYFPCSFSMYQEVAILFSLLLFFFLLCFANSMGLQCRQFLLLKVFYITTISPLRPDVMDRRTTHLQFLHYVCLLPNGLSVSTSPISPYQVPSLCLSLSPSLSLFFSLSFYLSFSPFSYPSQSTPLSVLVSVCLCLSVSVYLSLSISLCLSVSLYLSLSISLCLSVFVYLPLSICLCLSVSLYLSRLSVSLCLSVFFSLPVCLFVSLTLSVLPKFHSSLIL